MKCIVSEKGQVTLPKAVRVSLGLRPGTMLDFEVVDGHLVGTKSEASDPISRWRGKGLVAGGPTTSAEALAELRG